MKLLALLVTMWVGLVQPLLGSSCQIPPPCGAFNRSRVVLVGTLTEILEEQGDLVLGARLQVDQVFRGVVGKTIVVNNHGMLFAGSVSLGEQYLIYTADAGNGPVTLHGCSRSRPLRAADEDMRFLSSLASASPTGAISGSVWESVKSLNRETQGVPSAEINVSRNDVAISVLTDGEGHYRLTGLEPGKYIVTASAPGYRADTASDAGQTEVEVTAHGCASAHFALSKRWPAKIAGRVLKPAGEPAVGIELALFDINGTGDKRTISPMFGLDTKTDDQGQYEFGDIAPGQYLVAVQTDFPTPPQSYPTIYWPNSRTDKGAREITINAEESPAQYDFALPRAPSHVEIEGEVLTPNDEPAVNVSVIIHAAPKDDPGADSVHSVNSDAAGRFSFAVVEGFHYKVEAAQFTLQGRASSRPVELSFNTVPARLRLVLSTPDSYPPRE